MADAPPQLGNLPEQSDFAVPTLSSVGSDAASPAADTLQNAKNVAVSNASAALNAVAEHPVTKSVTETVNNAPVTQAAKEQAAKTQDEFGSLMNSRQTPATPAATGQNLTHYHSFFYDLLSWEHPRMSAIAYITTVTTIVAARYVPVLPMVFRFTAYTLGTVALTEGISKLAFSQSIVSAVRPKRYYTIPRETLESALGDVEQLINFFVIEFQRVLFAENVFVTFATFIASVLGYFLIKVTPVWGLLLMGVSTLFLAPLVYRTNKELIDGQLDHASSLINEQTSQIRQMAGQHTSHAQEALSKYTSQYSTQVQELLGNAKRQATPAQNGVKSSDFPKAPSAEPAKVPGATAEPAAA